MSDDVSAFAEKLIKLLEQHDLTPEEFILTVWKIKNEWKIRE